MKEGMNELIDEQRQDKIWNVWENQLRTHKAMVGDLLWDTGARSQGEKNVTAEGTVSEDWSLQHESFLPWKQQRCFKLF